MIHKAIQRFIGLFLERTKDIDGTKYACGLEASVCTRYNWSSREVCHLRGVPISPIFWYEESVAISLQILLELVQIGVTALLEFGIEI